MKNSEIDLKVWNELVRLWMPASAVDKDRGKKLYENSGGDKIKPLDGVDEEFDGDDIMAEFFKRG